MCLQNLGPCLRRGDVLTLTDERILSYSTEFIRRSVPVHSTCMRYVVTP